NEVVRKVIWSCLVEDCALFIRYILEKLTVKEKQEELISLLRKLIQLGPLPAQTAYTLLNYMIGFVMYYVRAPGEGSNEAIGMALSLIWLIIPSVQGLYFKDVKQTLKKEQCDAALMITANVPMAKKMIIQGFDPGSIPSQFNILEETQFSQVFSDCMEYFSVPPDQASKYFLVDAKTGYLHNPNSYVRDYYFFRRSFYPQLNFVQMDQDEGEAKMKQMAFAMKFCELGRVLLSYSVLKSASENIIPQRIYFLHEELTRLPAFPRKALESCFGMYHKTWGKELYGLDMMHKLGWAQLMTSMLRNMENPYLFGDLHLFMNVINGVFILHGEDSSILRHCLATYIELSIHFKAIFSTNGYDNMFGSIANILDLNDDELDFDARTIKGTHLFRLLTAMENLDQQKDTLEILSLVKADKPLKSLDMCYKDDPDTFCILTDAIASCVTICAYAPDSKRCCQMLMKLITDKDPSKGYV
uniref:Protein UNC80 C-terminal domain-containing protein n=1 Tax=Romanomermis culicivorax TaxID=13658 RepID=A0A915IVJ9_ROMCU